MAVTLSITVTDTQAQRVLVAFGHTSGGTNGIDPPTWVNATAADVRAWLLAQVRQRVLEYENAQVAASDLQTRSQETW